MRTVSCGSRFLFYRILHELYESSRIAESAEYIQHGATSVLAHSIAVAYFSLCIAAFFRLKVDQQQLIRGALLHDYFLYDWHEKDKGHRFHGFRHPRTAWRNADRDVGLREIEKDIVLKHMFPLTPKPPRYKESAVVCLADKICSIYEIFYMDSVFKLYGAIPVPL